MSLQIVLLMAGRGSRFAAVGYDRSKPLIDVDGRPMFAAALASLDALGPLDVVAVVREEQVRLERIDDRIRAEVPDARVVVLPGMTRGAAESAFAASGALDADEPVVVLDCDLEFRSGQYESMVRASADVAGVVLLTFEAHDPRYSFVRQDPAGQVVEIAEKRAISDRAVAGAYGFSSVRLFADAAESVTGGLGEFYMSAVVATLLRRGVAVRAAAVDSYTSFGTPEELDAGIVTSR